MDSIQSHDSAKKKARRIAISQIEKESFTEEDGREMYKNINNGSKTTPKFESESLHKLPSGFDYCDEFGHTDATEGLGDEDCDEVKNEYRDASLKMIVFMFSAFNFIHEAKTQREMVMRFWAVSSAIEHPVIEGKSDSQIAKIIGTTRANFSHLVLSFEDRNNLPPTLSQKKTASRTTYKLARKKQLA
jgi:hypothetical protein